MSATKKIIIVVAIILCMIPIGMVSYSQSPSVRNVVSFVSHIDDIDWELVAELSNTDDKEKKELSKNDEAYNSTFYKLLYMSAEATGGARLSVDKYGGDLWWIYYPDGDTIIYSETYGGDITEDDLDELLDY